MHLFINMYVHFPNDFVVNEYVCVSNYVLNKWMAMTWQRSSLRQLCTLGVDFLFLLSHGYTQLDMKWRQHLLFANDSFMCFSPNRRVGTTTTTNNNNDSSSTTTGTTAQPPLSILTQQNVPIAAKCMTQMPTQKQGNNTRRRQKRSMRMHCSWDSQSAAANAADPEPMRQVTLFKGGEGAWRRSAQSKQSLKKEHNKLHGRMITHTWVMYSRYWNQNRQSKLNIYVWNVRWRRLSRYLSLSLCHSLWA